MDCCTDSYGVFVCAADGLAYIFRYENVKAYLDGELKKGFSLLGSAVLDMEVFKLWVFDGRDDSIVD